MNRSAAVFAAALLLWISAEARASGEPPQPNVILILTDDQGYGDLGCHGNPVLKTPYLDKLHGESIRLVDFHVAPMCTPTRGQLMTGRDALANGAYCVCSGKTFLRRQAAEGPMPTMAEVFAAGGYRTAIFGKWHLGDNYPHRPHDRGFHQAVYHLGWGITSTPDYWDNDYFDDSFRRRGEIRQYPGYCTDVWFAEAARWIESRRERGEPFFAYVSTNVPHGPFYAPAAYRQPYADLDRDTAGFFAMIANLDDNVARLDAWLAETGLRENTIFIFMTDNGGTGGIKVYNAGLRGAKASLYEGGHRVPCFLRWPAGRLRPPGDVDALAHVQDLLPTLIEWCGLERPKSVRFDGTSLAPLLAGKEQPELAERMLVVQYGGLVETAPRKWDAAVLWNRWRLVAGKELYDVGADPGQARDVAAAHPGVVAKMRGHYEAWWRRVEPGLDDFSPIHLGSDAENPVRLSAMDWLSDTLVVAAQTVDVRQLGRTEVVEGSLPLGRPKPAVNGPWNVLVERAGQYRISLSRWPEEADAAITAGLPPYEGVDGAYPAGVALPAAAARLRIGPVDVSEPVQPADTAVRFDVALPRGRALLETWFYDAAGNELCGAFYVTVERR